MSERKKVEKLCSLLTEDENSNEDKKKYFVFEVRYVKLVTILQYVQCKV